MWRKTLPKYLAIGGIAATSVSVGTALLIEHYEVPTGFRYDWLTPYIAILGLFSALAAFAGTVWWARNFEAATRIAISIAIFFVIAMASFWNPNVHGDAFVVVVPVLLLTAVLGVILFIMGLGARSSE
ncbi:MAG TPA: hypothetical protein VGN17_20085 [Bryobacteraceae bacterium]|jgi:hypothetical protein